MTSYCVTCRHASQKSDDGVYCTKRLIWMSKYASCSDHTDLIKPEPFPVARQSKQETEKAVSSTAPSVESQSPKKPEKPINNTTPPARQTLRKESKKTMFDINEQRIDHLNYLIENVNQLWKKRSKELTDWLDSNPFGYDSSVDIRNLNTQFMVREDRERLYAVEHRLDSKWHPQIENAEKAVLGLINELEKAPISSVGLELKLFEAIDRTRPIWGHIDREKCENRVARCQPATSADSVQLAAFLASRNIENAVETIREGIQRFGDSGIRKQLVESLRNAGRLYLAMKFLDAEAKKYPQDTELRDYGYTFLVESLSTRYTGTEGKKESEIKLSALKLLIERGGKREVKLLERVFKQEEDEALKLEALKTLVSIQGSQAQSLVWEGLTLPNSSYFNVRLYAAKALGDIGDSSIVSALVEVLKVEESSSVRDVITSTLSKLDTEPRTFWEKLLGRRPWAK